MEERKRAKRREEKKKKIMKNYLDFSKTRHKMHVYVYCHIYIVIKKFTLLLQDRVRYLIFEHIVWAMK